MSRWTSRQTADGRWIVIEVNDAQESSFVGLNPLALWRGVIEAAQARAWLPFEREIGAGVIVEEGHSPPQIELEKMRGIAARARTEREVADAFAVVKVSFSLADDCEYDYEPGTPEHAHALEISDEWERLYKELLARIFGILTAEGVEVPAKGWNSVVAPFMARNGWRDDGGWWICAREAR